MKEDKSISKILDLIVDLVQEQHMNIWDAYDKAKKTVLEDGKNA